MPTATVPIKASRSYHSPSRAAQARHTRARVIDAATGLFLTRGYQATTVRAVADRAGVSVPTVEALFGTKAQLLKLSIDVAIAGDDAQAPMLERDGARHAAAATELATFASIVAEVLCQSQLRSAGLMMAVYEAASTDEDIRTLLAEREEQRAGTAGWICDRVAERATLRLGRAESIDTLWVLMDPAFFTRLTRQRGWNPARYQHWIADSIQLLLVTGPPIRRQT